VIEIVIIFCSPRLVDAAVYAAKKTLYVSRS
jgi:hypothetical protein